MTASAARTTRRITTATVFALIAAAAVLTLLASHRVNTGAVERGIHALPAPVRTVVLGSNASHWLQSVGGH